MGDERPDGWEVPVAHALASPQTLLLCGVPQTFCIVNILLMVGIIMFGTMLTGRLWWKMVVVSGVVHGITMVATAYEVQWVELWWRYRSYATSYEG